MVQDQGLATYTLLIKQRIFVVQTFCLWQVMDVPASAVHSCLENCLKSTNTHCAWLPVPAIELSAMNGF
jgi:hypothetical protein